jgi:HAD superfamily hydrolase (TIGR01549 family)
MKIKAVIFDLGDTLVLTDNWDYDKCLTSLMKSLQCADILTSTSFKAFKRVYFKVRHQMYLESEPTLQEVDFHQRLIRTLEKFDYRIDPESLVLTQAIEAFIVAFIEDLRIEKYTLDLLRQLKQKYLLGLVSNFAYAPGFWEVLRHFSLRRLFNAIVVSGEIGIRKPHPKIFLDALEALNVEAAEAVFVGDSLKADIYGAKRVGFRTVLVENLGIRKNPYAIAEELDPFPVEPDVKIPCLRELSRSLEGL